MWLANQTRPDIANAVTTVARYENKAGEVHWCTAIGILEHIFDTSDFFSAFQRDSGLERVAFADAVYASKATDRKSVPPVGLRCVEFYFSGFRCDVHDGF